MRFLYELFEEFQVVINVQPELELIEKIYKEIESKYRGFKKQIEVIEDRIIENQIPPEDPVVISNNEASTKAKSDYLKCTQSFAAYQRNCLDAKAKATSQARVFIHPRTTAKTLVAAGHVNPQILGVIRIIASLGT